MDNPIISIIVLSWNRELLLRNTILSLLVTTKYNFEIFIVDNASTDGSKEWLQVFSNFYPSIKVFFLDENIGGEAFNIPLSEVKGKYVLFSENDLEYLPGWDEYMIHQFESFPELGQLSPFAPNPMREIGEVWIDKPFEIIKEKDKILLKAVNNVTTTCLVKMKLMEQGLKWTNLLSKDGLFKFPADGTFSSDVNAMGYSVAWSDSYKAINWGFNQRIIAREREYYSKNWKEKSNYGIDGINLTSEKKSGIDNQDLYSMQQQIVNLQIENYDLKQKDLMRKMFTLENESMQFYFDLGKGFSEEASLKIPIQQNKKRYEFPLDPSKNYRQFRIDISDHPVRAILKRIFVLDVDNKEYALDINHSNSIKLNESEYIFPYSDPQFYCEILFSEQLKLNSFVIEFVEIKSDPQLYQNALRIANTEKESLIQEKNSQIQEKQWRINSLQDSKSYALGFLFLHPFRKQGWKNFLNIFKKEIV